MNLAIASSATLGLIAYVQELPILAAARLFVEPLIQPLISFARHL